MKSFIGNAVVKKTVSIILVLAVAAAVAFAAPMKAQNGFGDAKVYDSNYKAIQNPKEVSDNYVIKTSSSSVILSGDKGSIEIDSYSLLQVISLGNDTAFYLLDGKASFSSNAAFEVRTPVTVYKAQAGTTLYVITDEAEETAFVNKGTAEATNLITGKVAQIGKGQILDNYQADYQPTNSLREDYWMKPRAEQKPAQETTEQPAQAEPAEAAQQAEVIELAPLEHSFSYRGIMAYLRAYVGVAELDYPEFVTNEEIDAAARAAVLTFPETLTQDITYEVKEPGVAQIHYPETYGKTEFDMAVYLIEQSLPGYIDAILDVPASEEQQVAEAPAEEEQPATPEPQPAEPQPEERETIPSKAEKPSVVEEVPAPAEEEPAAEEKKTFRFGGTIGFIYGHGDRGDYFADPQFVHERAGVFLKNYLAIIDPVLSYGNIKFGLHVELDFRSGELVNPLRIFFGHGLTGVVNGVMQFVSLFSYEKGNFSFKIDRTSESDFTSPVATKLSRNYDHVNKLTATMNYKNGGFGFTAFVDDLGLNVKLAGHSQFAGAKITYLLGRMELGMSVAADFSKGFKKIVFYPAGEATLPFTIHGVGFELYGGAAAVFPADKTVGKAAMAEGMFSKTSGILTFGAGMAYSVRYNFNDIINNGPTSVISVLRGKSIDVMAHIGLNTEHVKLKASVTAPFALKGETRLVYNTVLTKYGNTASITADTMNFQADVIFGKFTFTAGAAFNGFAGRVADLFKAIKNSEGRRRALANMVDPEVSTYFAKAEFAPDLGPGNLTIYARADVMFVKTKIAIPFSAGIKYSF